RGAAAGLSAGPQLDVGSGDQQPLGAMGGVLGSGLLQRGQAARGPGRGLEDGVYAGKSGKGEVGQSSWGVGGGDQREHGIWSTAADPTAEAVLSGFDARRGGARVDPARGVR